MTSAARHKNTANDCCLATRLSGGPLRQPTTIAILGTRYADFSVEEEIFGPHRVSLTSGDGASADAIAEQASDATVVLAGSQPRFDATTISRLSCRGIVRYGVGVESVDLEAAARAGMWVAYVPDYGTDAVALHAVALLLALLRKLIAADAIVKSGGWSFESLRPLRSPPSLTVGIVGFGRIGRRVSELLAPFGFRLLAYDTFARVDSGAVASAATLEELIAGSDAITLHAPGDPDGCPLLGRAELARVKPGAVLVNTARGSLVDEEALADALQSGALGGAALDVYKDEPRSSWAGVDNGVILTPHMAWYTEESEVDLRRKAAQEALRLLSGETPLHVAARPRRET